MIVAVTELFEGRKGRASAEGVRTYTRMFHVLTDSVEDSGREIAEASGVPGIGDPFSDSDPAAKSTSVSPDQVSGTPYLWLVTVEYSSDPGTRSGSSLPENPLRRPAVIEWGLERLTAPVAKDLDGAAVVNSAGDRFDPLPEIDVAIPILRVTKNRASYDAGEALSFVNTVNKSAFLGFGPGRAKCQAITASQQFENGIEYFAVVYEFAGRREGWQISVVDFGEHYLDGDEKRQATTPVHDSTTDANFIDDAVPGHGVPLDGAGGRLGRGESPVFLDFRVYDETDFNDLGIP